MSKKGPILLTDVDVMTVKQLREEVGWPLEYTSTIALAPYVKRLGSDLVGASIGTCRGEGDYYLLDKCPNIKKLYAIDSYKEYEDWSGIMTQEIQDQMEAIAKQNFEEFGHRVEMVKKTSLEAVSMFEDRSLDFVFVDGAHDHDSVLEDLRAYYKKVKPGGIFAGHDYNLDGVFKAIMEFREENKIRVPINVMKNFVWMWNVY